LSSPTTIKHGHNFKVLLETLEGKSTVLWYIHAYGYCYFKSQTPSWTHFIVSNFITRKCLTGSIEKGHETVDFVCWFGHVEADNVHQKVVDFFVKMVGHVEKKLN